LAEGVEKGFDMVVCPNDPFYLDYVQDIKDKVGHLVHRQWVNEMKEIYEYPIIDNPKIIGTQTNIWTEKVVTTDRLEYMLFPRVVAQAEKAWTKSKNLNYKNFLERLENEYKYLDSIDIYYYDFRENSRREEPQR
jgi:hexosaminidase